MWALVAARASVVVVGQLFSSCRAQAVEHGLSCPAACEILGLQPGGMCSRWLSSSRSSSSPERPPKSQLAVEQPSPRGHWNPPKKKIPHVQGQGRSYSEIVGAEQSQCNQSLPPPGGRPTRWTAIIPEVLALLQGFWAPSQAAQPGDREKGIPRESDFEGQEDFSSPVRDQACISYIGRQILNHWTTSEVPSQLLLTLISLLNYFVTWCTKRKRSLS